MHVRSRFRYLGALLLIGAILLPAFAADKDEKKDGKPDTPKSALENLPVPAAEKWTTVGDMVGVLDKVNGASISLKVDYQETSIQRVGKTYRPKAVAKSKDVDLILADDVKVRVGAPPREFDDKGGIKKYTPEELKNLKGSDTKVWGYASDTNALKTGDVVRVIVGRKKSTASKSKGVVPDEPTVRLIYILKDSGGSGDKKN